MQVLAVVLALMLEPVVVQGLVVAWVEGMDSGNGIHIHNGFCLESGHCRHLNDDPDFRQKSLQCGHCINPWNKSTIKPKH